MFEIITNDISKSIKVLAKVMYIIDIVFAALSLVVGIIGAIICIASYGIEGLEFLISLGCGLGSCVLFLINIITVIFVYGFGELIELNKTK